MQISLVLPSVSYNSSIQVAAFINGVLVSHYQFPLLGTSPPSGPGQGQLPTYEQYGLPIVINSTLSSGSTITVALIPSSVIYLNVAAGSGSSSLLPGENTIPQVLPTSVQSSQPAFVAWGN